MVNNLQRICKVVFAFSSSLTLSGCWALPLPAPPVPAEEIPPHVFDFLLLDEGEVLLFAERTFYRSIDDGASWSEGFRATEEDFVRSLTIGADGSIWATIQRIPEAGPDTVAGLIVSYDKGTTFQIINFLGRDFVPFDLIEVPGEDPLVVGHFNSQLFQSNGEAPLSVESLVPWGEPNPFGLAGGDVVCRDALYLLTAGAELLEVSILSASDQGTTWQVEVETFAFGSRLACGSGTNLWAVFGALLIWFDANAWAGLDIMDDVSPRIIASPSQLTLAAAGHDGAAPAAFAGWTRRQQAQR